MPDLTLQKRIEDFNKELLELLKKHDLGLGAVPFINPDGRVGANPHVFDAQELKKQPLSSE